MDTPKIVILSGWLQAGKDTMGEVLCKRFGFKRYAFADVMKDELASVLKIDRKLLDCGKGKKLVHEGKTIRQHLIDYGQGKRKEDPYVWVKKVCEKINKDKPQLVVITDWRMPNEIEGVIKEFGHDNVISCRINRWIEPPLKDYTELALDDFPFDHVISNIFDLDFLDGKVNHFMETFFGEEYGEKENTAPSLRVVSS